MELSIQRPQQLGKTHTAGRKVRREILRQRLSPPQERRAGVVEGIVRIGIMGLPAVAPQGTVPADLLRRPVKQHGGVLRPQQRRRVVLQAVIPPPGRPPQVPRPPETPLRRPSAAVPSFSGSSSHTPAAVSSWHSTARGRTSPSSRAASTPRRRRPQPPALFVRSAALRQRDAAAHSTTARYSSPVPHRSSVSPASAPAAAASGTGPRPTKYSSRIPASTTAGENPITVQPAGTAHTPAAAKTRPGACPPAPPPTPAADRAATPPRHTAAPATPCTGPTAVRPAGSDTAAGSARRRTAAIGRKRGRRYSRVLHSAVLAQKISSAAAVCRSPG